MWFLGLLFNVICGITVAGLVCASVESILQFFNEYLKDKYKEPQYLIVNKIKHNIKSGNVNIVNIGIYDNNNHLIGNEDITCEEIDSNLKVKQKIYI